MNIPKISAYMINYYDYSFLESVMSTIDKYIDELIIIDGPYTYSVPTLKKYNLLYNSDNKPDILNNLIKKYPKIKYIYKIFNNEEEKRIFGYNECKNDIVLVQDADEIIVFNENITTFLNNKNKFVGEFDIYNMNRINIFFDFAQKMLLFKKNKIGSREHLDYLWLIGCKQNKPNTNYILIGKPLGINYHQTLNRRKKDNLIKFIFYSTLANHSKNSDNIFSLLPTNIENQLTNEEIFNIYMHSTLDRICITPHYDKYFKKIDPIINLEQYSKNFEDYIFLENKLGVKNIQSMYLLDKSKFKGEVHIFFYNVTNIKIDINVIRFGEKKFTNTSFDCELTCHDNKSNMYIKLEDLIVDYNLIFEVVITFLCKETNDTSDFYRINEIKYL